MVYGIVAVILLCMTVKGYSGKRTSGYVKTPEDSFLFNLLRMVFCIAIGILFVFAEGSQSFLRVEWGMLGICVLAGLSNAAFLVGWLLAVRKNSMVSVDVGLTMGSLIPAVLCALLFSEAISVPKMIGFALILAATVILAGHSKKTVGTTAMGVVLLVLAAVGDGMSGFVQQLYRQYYTEAGSFTHGVFYPKTVYHFYTYVFSAVALLAVLTAYRLRPSRERQGRERGQNPLRRIPPTAVLHVFIMAVCLFAANYLQTVATNNYGMSSQVLYPILKGGCLITVNFVAMIFFGERITRRSVCGSLVALLGIVAMNLL